MPIIDLAFRVQGTAIPADHGYLLFQAITKLIPDLHPPGQTIGEVENVSSSSVHIVDSEVGPLWKTAFVHPINGQLSGDRMLRISPKSRLTLRLDSDRISEILPLAGKTLRLGKDAILVGTPTIYALKPAPRLYSRLVVIRGYTEPAGFLEAAGRQLKALGIIQGKLSLPLRKGKSSFEGKTVRDINQPSFIKRTIHIKDKEVVGFAVEVSELAAEESLLLQEKGVGGRQHFGCGVFIPATRSVR